MAHFEVFSTVDQLWSLLQTYRQQNVVPLLNGYVIQLYFDSGKNVTVTAEKVGEVLHLEKTSLSALKPPIWRLVKKFVDLKKHFKVKGIQLYQLLSDQFSPVDSATTTTTTTTTTTNTTATATITTATAAITTATVTTTTNTGLDPLSSSTSSAPPSQTHQNKHPSAPKTRTDCAKCTDIKDSNASTIERLVVKNKKLRTENKHIKIAYNIRKVNQRFKRLYQRIGKLSQKYTLLKRDNIILKSKLKVQQSYPKETVSSLKRKLNITQKQLHSANSMSKKLKYDVDAMYKELEVLEDRLNDDNGGEGNKDYHNDKVISDPIRKCVYKCLISNVPNDTTASLIAYLSTCLGCAQQAIPHTSTVSRCAYELGILNDLQTAQFMLASQNLTLAWDATTLRGSHINQVMVTSEDGAMCVSSDVLPGGTAEDYADHLVSSITKLAVTHAKFVNLDHVAVLRQVMSKFKCTMSDRASVNHCAAVRLMNRLQVDLLELNCQIHPLESFATAARDALLVVEREIGKHPSSKTYGPMAGAVNVVAAISKLRYKDGKGDPAGFKAFLKSERIDGNLLIRYVGNRLHALFHLAGSVFHLKDKLLCYLKQCNQKTLRLAIIADLSDHVIITHLQVLGLFGKVVTGPWMAVIYSPGAERQHMKKTKEVLDCIQFINQVSSNPQMLLDSEEDAFGQPLTPDNVILSLRATTATELFVQSATAIATRVHSKLEKQLLKYKTDPRYDPSSKEIQDRTSSASTHNMACERGLGMVDYLCRRAPNANIKTIDSKVRGSLNGTMEWLECQEQQSALLSFARKEGATFRKQYAILTKRVEEKVLQRQQEKGQEREMTNRRKKEREVLNALGENAVKELLDGQSEEVVGFVDDLLAGSVGTTFQHLWSTKEGKDEEYFGRIEKHKMERGVKKIWISYWQGENDAEAVDFLISLHSLIADVILGDVFLKI